MSAGVQYLGSKISLISKYEIRYEGVLYMIDTKKSTAGLAKVRSFGTEDRPTERPVAPRDKVHEYIIFRASDIKDLHICELPKPQPILKNGLVDDPAIVQTSCLQYPNDESFAIYCDKLHLPITVLPCERYFIWKKNPLPQEVANMKASIRYLGSKISLVSKSEMRYEGVLCTIDTEECTVALAKVKSFGTEDRPTERPVAPRDKVYGCIIFRASDIKDLHVCELPDFKQWYRE